MDDLIQVNHLTKKFNDFTAVNDLSFTVPKGSIYGFLGQNGAGKSTTIRMLTSLITPTAGSISIMGKNMQQQPTEVLKNIGAVIERPDLYKYLTAYENVQLLGKLSGVKVTKQRIIDVLQLVGLGNVANKKMKTFSQGMKQRLGIATALVHDPQLILLDEPVNGLDPQGIADMRSLILQLQREHHKTILLSSHLLGEMEMIATDLLIIHKGKKVVEGKLTDLLQPNKVQLELVTKQSGEMVKAILQVTHWKNDIKKVFDYKIIIVVTKTEVSDFNAFLVAQNINVQSLKPLQTLEDYFIQQTAEQAA